jgi:hypothetical protein
MEQVPAIQVILFRIPGFKVVVHSVYYSGINTLTCTGIFVVNPFAIIAEPNVMYMNKSIHIVFFTLIVFIVNGLIHNTNAQQRPLKKRPVKVGRSMKNNGQDSIERKYIISCYPVNFIATTIKVGYEFKLSPHKGFKFIAAFGNADATGNVTDSNTF